MPGFFNKKSNKFQFLLITLLLFSLLITSCAPKQFVVDQLPIGNWSIAMIKAAEGTSIETIDAKIANSNGWAVITPSNANAIVKLHPTNTDITIIRLVRPGKNECPSWAIGLFPGDLCEIIEKPIKGEAR